jgi:hypothetical protein
MKMLLKISAVYLVLENASVVIIIIITIIIYCWGRLKRLERRIDIEKSAEPNKR